MLMIDERGRPIKGGVSPFSQNLVSLFRDRSAPKAVNPREPALSPCPATPTFRSVEVRTLRVPLLTAVEAHSVVLRGLFG